MFKSWATERDAYRIPKRQDAAASVHIELPLVAQPKPDPVEGHRELPSPLAGISTLTTKPYEHKRSVTAGSEISFTYELWDLCCWLGVCG